MRKIKIFKIAIVSVVFLLSVSSVGVCQPGKSYEPLAIAILPQKALGTNDYYVKGELIFLFSESVMDSVRKVTLDLMGVEGQDAVLDSLKKVKTDVPKTGISQLDSLNVKYGLKAIVRVEPNFLLFLYSLDTDVVKALEEYKRLSFLKYVQLDYLYFVDSSTSIEYLTLGTLKSLFRSGLPTKLNNLRRGK